MPEAYTPCSNGITPDRLGPPLDCLEASIEVVGSRCGGRDRDGAEALGGKAEPERDPHLTVEAGDHTGVPPVDQPSIPEPPCRAATMASLHLRVADLVDEGRRAPAQVEVIADETRWPPSVGAVVIDAQ